MDEMFRSDCSGTEVSNFHASDVLVRLFRRSRRGPDLLKHVHFDDDWGFRFFFRSRFFFFDFYVAVAFLVLVDDFARSIEDRDVRAVRDDDDDRAQIGAAIPCTTIRQFTVLLCVHATSSDEKPSALCAFLRGGGWRRRCRRRGCRGLRDRTDGLDFDFKLSVE